MYFTSVIKDLRKRIAAGGFLKNVLTLMTGTILAQVLTAAISPFLTRMYTPSDFGVYALFLSITSILAVMVAGRYELAIVLPEKREDGLSIVVLCLILSLITSSLVSLLIAIFRAAICSLFNIYEMQSLILYIPLSIFMTAIYQSCYYWFNRTKNYGIMSKTRVIAAVVTSTVSLLFGYYKGGVEGLIYSTLLGQFFSTVVMFYNFLLQEKINLSIINKENIYRQAKKYINFPKFLIMGHLFNNLSSQLPIILLNVFFGVKAAGYFSLAQRVVGLPMSFIGSSIGEVFRQRVAEDYNRLGNCRDSYLNTFKNLLKIGFVPFLLLFFCAPILFSLVFGEQWEISGKYVQIMTFMFFCQFIASPMGCIMAFPKRLKIDLLWQIVLSMLVFLSFVIGNYIFNDSKSAIVLFTISYIVMYLINLVMTYHYSGNTH